MIDRECGGCPLVEARWICSNGSAFFATLQPANTFPTPRIAFRLATTPYYPTPALAARVVSNTGGSAP